MRWTSIVCLLLTGLVGLSLSPIVIAHEKVVVVPLFVGGIGNANPEDVLKDKTFSSEEGKGLTGSRPGASVPKSGQRNCYNEAGLLLISCAGTGQDGDYQSGVAWPNPRFTDNGNGTVTDNLTDLVWLKNANCFGAKTWTQALSDSNGLAAGYCGLTDGSSEGDWRLPNAEELHSLIDLGYSNPALANTTGAAKWTEGDAFSGVLPNNYWSSTSWTGFAEYAWVVNLIIGNLNAIVKTQPWDVWPVRDRQ